MLEDKDVRAETTEARRSDVYATLRREILTCVLTPGQSLHESELSARFAVSKSPIRDALMRLEADRLITVIPRKGYRVMPVSLSDASDLFELRMLMEEGAMRNTAVLANKDDLSALDRFRSFESWRDKGGFLAYNRDFHIGISAICPNRRIRDMTRDVIEQFDRIVVISMSVNPDVDAALYLKEHCAILDAMQERDARKATKLLRNHIEGARGKFIGSVISSSVVP